MLVNGKPYRSIWDEDGRVMVIDQTMIPFEFRTIELKTCEDAASAIRGMTVRGAPLIGATAAYGIFLASKETTHEDWLPKALGLLGNTRPTAVNLHHALKYMKNELVRNDDAIAVALEAARRYCEKEVDSCMKIGEAGLPLIKQIHERKSRTVNILTHCNAGWLACIDYGTATAPIYLAHRNGIPVHVWVSETRPRNQGSRLTAWELQKQGIPCTIIADNAAGHLMQREMVDLVLTGSDRTSITGDVANKIGTYLKALAAHEHKIPFWVALPTSTIDLSIDDGISEIPIEERDQNEVLMVQGWDPDSGMITDTSISPGSVSAFNPGFDVTPGALVNGLITEKGLCGATKTEILRLLHNG